MKTWFVIFLIRFVFCSADTTTGKFEYNFNHQDVLNEKQSVENLIKRVLPNHFTFFKISVSNAIDQDTFKIFSSGNGSVQITGHSAVDVASGLNYYLKYFCNSQIAWQNEQINVPNPPPKANITIKFNDKYRYYQNICTSSYSFVWWNWEQWEKHIDWIALNGFNLVLTPNGQEYVWNLVYNKLGMTKNEIDEYFTGPAFLACQIKILLGKVREIHKYSYTNQIDEHLTLTGPAFLAWNRMGNLRGWGGPLSDFWHNRSYILQTKILTRMRDLGIVPVIPGFSGHVPRAFKRLFPNSKLTKMPPWSKFNDSYSSPYLLDPEDDLFKTIGSEYYGLLNQLYGTTNNNINTIYSADIFNEMTPISDNLIYLKNIGKAVFSTMVNCDPGAIWLLQGWFFYNDPFWTKERAEAFITSVPLGKMLILDLQSEQFPQYDRLDSYFGQPFIWCMLHDFGGTLGMFGSAEIINKEPFRARNKSSMVGIGLTPEGINQNYVIYDLMSEMSWRQKPSDLTEWFANYSSRRYGLNNMSTNRTWQILKNTVYNFSGNQRMRGKYSINTRPSLQLKNWSWYKSSDLFESFVIFLEASASLADVESYHYDLVDLSRQVLQVLGDEYHKKIVDAFRGGDLDDFMFLKNDILGLFDDLELILQSNENFLLGKWLSDAKRTANEDPNDNSKTLAQYEYNARNQITLWGPNGEIRDYANKQWAGVVVDYFKPRWLIFLNELQNCLVNKTKFNETSTFRKMFSQVEKPFTYSTKEYSVLAKGNAIDIARYIRDKWTLKGVLNFDKTKYISELSFPQEFLSNLYHENDIDVIMLNK